MNRTQQYMVSPNFFGPLRQVCIRADPVFLGFFILVCNSPFDMEFPVHNYHILLFIVIILKDIDFIKYRQVSINPLPSNHMFLFFVRLLDFYSFSGKYRHYITFFFF